MKVNPEAALAGGIAATRTGQALELEGTSKSRTEHASAISADRVELSGYAALLRIEGADSVSRTRLIEELARLYRTGNYQPDPVAVSRKLVSEALASGAAARS